MKELDYDKIKEAAKAYNADMTAFLRAMISPSRPRWRSSALTRSRSTASAT